MFHVAARNLWAHKRRLVSTLLAVAIGVSFLAGTLVLTDTIRTSFDSLFQQVNAGLDVVVRPEIPADEEADDTDSFALIDETLVDEVRRVQGVERAVPVVSGFGRLVGADGTPLGGNGPPTLAGSWADDPTEPYRLVEGSAPARDTDVVIDRRAAETGRLRIGDTATLQTPAPIQVTITGIVRFGEQDSAGGTTFTGFTLEGAQRHVLGQAGKITSISIAGRDGIGEGDLARAVAGVLPPGTEAMTGSALAQQQRAAIDADFLDFLNRFLLVFAGIALLVASISIYNTFSILTAQRTRESALLRALGASRRQVLGAALTETFAVGAVASVLGVVAGVGLAAGLRELFSLVGADVPAENLVLSPRTAIIGLAVGVVVTIAAGVLPARRSSRVAPLAALRDVSVDSGVTSAVRLMAGALATAAGGAVVLQAAIAGGDNVLLRAGAGALIGLVGIVVLGPALATVVSPLIGWPLAAARPATGTLARRNAARNPRRTSGTAAALMIGVAVVTMFTVLAQSIKASVTETVTKSFGGDLVVSSQGSGVSPALATDLAATPEIETAAGLGVARARVDGRQQRLTAADPQALGRVLDLDETSGSVAELGDHQLAVSADEATSRGWSRGSTVPVTFTDGVKEDFTVGAVFGNADVTSAVIIRRADWAPHAVQDRDNAVLVRLAEGVGIADGRAVAERLTAPYAGVKVEDREQFIASTGAEINQALTLIYVMLALAIVIALMGIANTLSLSVHERTRELGLLRAVGQTRRQVRAMVRGESVIIALFGTLTGLGLGVFLGWALVKAAASADEGVGVFSAAPGQLAILALAGAMAGMLAAVRPARRAARLDVLAAIATE